MTTTTKKAPRKRTPPPPPCLCEECKRETCHGIGKPLEFGGLGTFGDDAGPAPAAARLAIAKAIIRNADAGVKIPPRVVKMARAEVERLS